MSGFDRDGVDREFFPEGPDRRLTSLLLVNIGHPDDEDSWREREARLPRRQGPAPGVGNSRNSRTDNPTYDNLDLVET
ncbi:hypothetical protein [Streptomyces phaeochromogenes]|uniref:hypothetical protein n=1 Tax=Streptomyces phaeochromogenes TaxID=1923 RepID=UPI002DDBF51C|nr:hypothetical protein [Streptomyces phaeochromogenes]WRZ29378.1 hypothetical protein OG931_17255 [Streptomyces phaeochromogenes]